MPRRPSYKKQLHIADVILWHLEQIRLRLWEDDCEDVLDDVWSDFVAVRDLIVDMVFVEEE